MVPERIYIAFGSNLASEEFGEPAANINAALTVLFKQSIEITACSSFYRTAPVPLSDQPDFVNAVAEVRTALSPRAVLSVLHAVEARFGRIRSLPNAARTLDLDLLAYGNRIILPPLAPTIPHPRLHERVFVLRPMADLDVLWRHPILGLTVNDMLQRLPPGECIRMV